MGIIDCGCFGGRNQYPAGNAKMEAEKMIDLGFDPRPPARVPKIETPRNAAAGRAMAERWLTARGYVRDGWGNYKLPGHPDRRYHFSKIVLRLERRNEIGDWFRIRAGFYRRLYVDAAGNLCGLRA